MRVVWSCLVNLGNDARTPGSNQLLSSADSSPLPCQIGGDNRATAHQSGLAQCCPPPGLEPRTCISRARCTANWVCVALRAFPICPKRVPGLIGVALRTPSLQGFGGFAPPSTRASSRLVTSQPPRAGSQETGSLERRSARSRCVSGALLDVSDPSRPSSVSAPPGGKRLSRSGRRLFPVTASFLPGL